MDSLLEKIKRLKDNNKKIKFSKEEIKELVNLLSIEELKLRFFVGSLIIYQGLKSLQSLSEGIHSEIPEIRRSSVYLLGKLFKKEQKVPLEILDALHHALFDEDPKVRKNSAIVLGELKKNQSVEHLINAIKKEKIKWVKLSMILALGAIGGKQAIDFLSSYQPIAETEEQKVLSKALDHSLKLESNWQFLQRLPKPILLELWTFNGLESVLEQEVKEKLLCTAKRDRNNVVVIETNNVYSLFSLRTFTEIIIPIININMNTSEVEEIKAKIIYSLYTNNMVDKFLSLHKGDESNIRYRLEVRGNHIKHHIRRSIIKEVTQSIKTFSPLLINSPSNYDIEIRIIIEKNNLRILWKPFTILDSRFNYRVQDVPSAINPVVAAGIMKFVKAKLSPHHRMIDPFCGSGTILIERALIEGCKELVGIDISQKAIEAARQNVRVSGIKNIKLINDDMRNILKHEHEKFNEIITNMPFGIRTGTHETNVNLYRDFFNMIQCILEKKGIIVLYTQEINLTTDLFQTSNNLKLLNVYRVESGGLKPAIFVACRMNY